MIARHDPTPWLRIVRNRSAIGKPWQIVRGAYTIGPLQYAKHGHAGRKTWKTELFLADFDSRELAEVALRDYQKGEGP